MANDSALWSRVATIPNNTAGVPTLPFALAFAFARGLSAPEGGIPAGEAWPLSCIKQQAWPNAQLPVLKFLQLGGCQKSQSLPLLQVPVLKNLHAKVSGLPEGDLPLFAASGDFERSPFLPFPPPFPLLGDLLF